MISKEELIEVLRIWNVWDGTVLNNKKREHYQSQINLFKKSKEVIVLKGIRRSGKSSLLNLEIRNLLEKGVKSNNILFLNFEEPKFNDFLNLNFLDYIYETYLEYLEPEGKVYIFLDEVQNIPAWEKWVLRQYETSNSQIYVTGSSSKLLSSEFSTALSGRHLSITVYPLSFKEYLEFNDVTLKNKLDLVKNKLKIKKLFKKYLLWGGFPKISELEIDLLKKNELISYYDTIILKDIAKRHNISNINDLKKISYYLLSNTSKYYSLNNLKNLEYGSYDTIKKYVEFLKETYLLFDLEMYSVSVKKQLRNPNKIYAVDSGVINSISFKFSQDLGRVLENIVFLEFKRNGAEIYYHKNKHECDFVLKEGMQITLALQVTKSLSNNETRKRELAGLLEAIKEHNLNEGIIVTEDEEETLKIDDKKIEIIPIWKWLLK